MYETTFGSLWIGSTFWWNDMEFLKTNNTEGFWLAGGTLTAFDPSEPVEYRETSNHD